MDPNANLSEIRRLVAELNGDDEVVDYRHKAARLAELVEALDAWISRGGFLPAAWVK